MERLKAFWRELTPQLAWLKSFENPMKTILGYLAIAGITSATFVAFFKTNPWFLLLALLPAVVFLTWVVAIAAERSAGPIMWLGENLQTDELWSMLYLSVRNSGNGEVIAQVYATELRDANEERLHEIASDIEIHWRGLSSSQQMTLFTDKVGQAGVLRVGLDTPGNPRPYLCSPSDASDGFKPVPLTGSVPLDQRQELRLTLRVDFRNMIDNKIVRSKVRRFSITPDETSTIGYQSRPID